MLVQSVILLFELKHFGRVPLFKRFCHLLFAALLDDSTEPGYFGRPRVAPFFYLLHCHRLKFWRLVELESERITVVIKLLFVVTSE